MMKTPPFSVRKTDARHSDDAVGPFVAQSLGREPPRSVVKESSGSDRPAQAGMTFVSEVAKRILRPGKVVG